MKTSSASQPNFETPIRFFHSLRGKLIVLFLVVSLIPLISVGLLAYIQAQNALKDEIINKLIAVRDIKAKHIARYFEERQSDVKVLSQNMSLIAAVKAFDKAIETNMKVLNTDEAGAMNHYRTLYLGQSDLFNANDGSSYSAIHAKYHPVFKEYKEAYGYYDIFLVEPHTGNIVYSIEKESDYGTSLKIGPYADTNIGEVFQHTVLATHRNFTRLEDYAYYEPSKEAASFVASPIFDGVTLIGVLIFQLPTDQINNIMQEHTGLGESGETVLVSSDDFLLRSDSRLSQKSTLFKQKRDNEATRAAATGQTGVKTLLDHRGKRIIIAHTPLNISGVKWSLNAQIDEVEALAKAHQMLIWILIILGIGTIIVVGIALFFSNSIAKPVQMMTNIARSLAVGNLNLTITIDSKDEIGVMANAFRQMLTNQRLVIEDIVQVSQGLAAGNLSITPQTEYQGDFTQIKTALKRALSNQQYVVEDIVHVSKELAAGNLHVQLAGEYQGDFQQIKQALELALTNQSLVIEDIVNISQGLAEGHLNIKPQSEYRGDFAQIKTALEIGLSNQRLVIEDIVRVSQGLAEGNLSIQPQSEYRGDFQHIKNAQETALSNQKSVIEDLVQVSQSLAFGDLHIRSQAQYRGDFIQIKTALETALSNLRQVIEDIVRVSQGLAEGTHNVTPQAEYQGDFVQIKTALTSATVKLTETSTKNATQDWLKTGQAQLNEIMSGEQQIATLAKNIMTFLVTYTQTSVGLFYLLTEAKQPHNQAILQMIASYAYTTNENIPQQFLLGEGLVGQVALEQKPLSRIHTPEEYTYIIQSGLTKTVPSHVILLPCLYENTVKAVIEIGSSQAFSSLQHTFLEQVMSSIGIAINTAKSRTQMQELLQTSQQQTEELQSQSEELQSQQEEMQQINEELQHQREELEHKQAELQQRNEELQSQSEEVQSQSEELQTQQEELKQTNESLEERTKELERQKSDIQHKNLALEKTQTEMKQTQIALETKATELELASRYKSEFLANMSHELRTPLNSLLILAQLLSDNKSGNLNDKQVEYAKTIHSAGFDLLTLINEILDLSKVEAGKIEVNLEEISLSALIEMLEPKFRHQASEKGLAFQMTLADNLPACLHTDGQRLKQILNNLLSNAFKFTNQGEVRLEIQSASSLSSKDIKNFPSFPLGAAHQKFIVFSVSDTGIGIPKDKQQTIFEAFQQADGSTSRRYGGTGLGLSISRQLAKLLGGELQLQSEEEQGSTFILYLPEKYHQVIGETPSMDSDFQTNTLMSKSSEQTQLVMSSEPTTEMSMPEQIPTVIKDDRSILKSNDKSLLIIEDDDKFSGILVELGHEKAFKCLLAEDGRTGLQLAEEYQPTAIILDVGLPQIDGWNVMERLKDNPDTRHIPVHFISASEQKRLEATKMGAIGFLNKPVNLKQLGEVFKKIEQFITSPFKNLLVIVDVEPHQQKILELVSGDNIQTTLAVTTTAALKHLQETWFDCIILDIDIAQGTGEQLLKQMQQTDGLCQTPVIIYADRHLTAEEEALLFQCAEHLPLKAVQSSERLLDEATLFLHQVEANLPAQKRQMLRMVHDKEAILTKKKVLIVDDDVRNVFALATVLEDKQMEVIAGNNGNEALELLEKHQDIAIILMDIMMPTMDGYEAMRAIRKQECFRKLPIIALTAKAMKGDKNKCIEAGANDYLSKPVDTEKLISLMRVWLYR